MAKLKIRRFQLSDQKEIFELHKKALIAIAENFYLSGSPWEDDFKDLESTYIRPGGEFLVGEIEGKIVAIGALKKLSEDRAEIKRMRVDPDFQRRGFGQIILDELEVRAKELGFKSLQLDTALIQKAARKLYEKNGYKEFGRGIINGSKCIFYEKKLSD